MEGWSVVESVRPMIAYMRAMYHDGLIGAEVGVEVGNNASNILINLSKAYLHLIDNYNNEDPFIEAQERLKPFEGRIQWHKTISLEAARQFNDNFFDFVYIDADHNYTNVKNDIDAWYPKVKRGGVIGGHDYYTQEKRGIPDVTKAVDEFCRKNNLYHFVRDMDWWIIKDG